MENERNMEIFNTAQDYIVNWTIDRHNELTAFENGQFIESPVFEFNGNEWKLLYYPNGDPSASAGYSLLSIKLVNANLLSSPIKAPWVLFIENIGNYVKFEPANNLFERKKDTHLSRLSSTPGNIVSYVRNDKLTLGAMIKDKKIGNNYLPYSITQCMYANSSNGDMQILCKNGQVVRADKVVLCHDPYFSTMMHFKSNQSPTTSDEDTQGSVEGVKNLLASASIQTVVSPSQGKSLVVSTGNTANLEDFSASTVNRLLEFIYTGITSIPKTIEERCELYSLADFTTNRKLSDLVYQEMKEFDINMDSILVLLILLRGRPLPIRKDAVEYYLANRIAISKLEDFGEWRDALFEDLTDLEFIKKLF